MTARDYMIITEELLELNKVIAVNAELEKLYPDDFALKLGLDSLKARQKELHAEYEEACKNRHIEAFDLTL